MIVKAAIKQDGNVFVGHRHPDIIKMMNDNDIKWNPLQIQGFITDDGTFFNRKDARQHFINSGQVSVDGKLRPDALYSEDLY